MMAFQVRASFSPSDICAELFSDAEACDDMQY